VGPPAQASPPNLAVSGLLSYLNYVSERPSCLCCEADITSQLSAVFFSPQYPTFSAALSKLCWISNSSLFIFQGTQVQAGASTSAVSGLLSFYATFQSVLAASVAKPTLHRSSVQFSLGLFSPEQPTFYAALSKLHCIEMQILHFLFSRAPNSGRCWHLSSKWLTFFSKLRFRAS